MGIFKFAKAELKKIFLRPVIYFVPIILALLVILTAQLYNPTARPGNANIVSSFTATDLEGLNTEFEASALQTNSEDLANKINEIITFYKNNEDKKKVENETGIIDNTILSIKTIYDTKIYADQATRVTPMSEIAADLDILVNSMRGTTTTIIPTQALDAMGRLKTKLNNLESKLSALLNTKTLNSFNAPVIITTNDTINKLYSSGKSDLSLTEQFIDLIVDAEKTGANQFNTVKQNADKMQNIFNEIKSYLAKIEDVSLDISFLDELAQYPTALRERQTLQLAKISASATFEECKDAILNYSYNIDIMENIFASKLYLKVLGDKSDEVIFKLYKLNANIYASTPTTSLYKYGINEDLTKYVYLWENWSRGISLSNVNNNFNLNYTMGEETTALDYSFYSMEFISFFIILITAIIAASIVAGEYPSGTIKMLAIRPYSRNQILAGKFLAALCFSAIFILFSSIITTIVGHFMFGALDISTNILMILNGQWVVLMNPLLMFLIYMVSIFFKTIMFTAIAMFISVLFKSNLPAVLISILSSIIGLIIITFFGVVPALTYIPFTNTDLFKFTGGQFISPGSGTAVSAFTSPILLNNSVYISAGLILLTSGLFIIAAQAIFKKRDIQ